MVSFRPNAYRYLLNRAIEKVAAERVDVGRIAVKRVDVECLAI